jgi:predicted RNA-binding Zn-ribbon protein involved in translation (DUF1610 family)
MPDHHWTEEYTLHTLLCENCGYVIEGLDTNGNCPECGKPIQESLPERRQGTPWQQNPSIGSLVRTWWMTLRHPLRTLDVMKVGGRRNRYALQIVTIFAASLIAACGFVALPVYETIRSESTLSELQLVLTIFIFALIPPFPLLVLTWIESRGLTIISRTRGFRVDTPLSSSITSHGGVGWLLAAVLFSILYPSGGVLIESVRPSFVEYYERRVLTGIGNEFPVPPAPDWVYWVDRALWGTGLLLGFCFFEIFAYLGLRRCKFANRARTDHSKPRATA